MLSFMILWLLSNQPMYGQELATEIAKPRVEKNRIHPGTIYPAIKDLSNRGLIRVRTEGCNTVYELTRQGRASLAKALEYFHKAFVEIFYATLNSIADTLSN